MRFMMNNRGCRPQTLKSGLRGRGRAVVPAALIVMLSGCEGVLDPAGPIGRSERLILLDSLAIMLAIVVPTILCTLAFAWWFRASNRRAAYAPTWEYSGRLELLVWSVPALVVCFLGGIAWIGSHDLDPAKPLPPVRPALEVDVVALDWKWLFIYPEQHVASLNRLVTPIGTPLHLRLTSASVMNVFFVPQLGSEIYAMNGMVTELNLQADREGHFFGLAAHFNGDGFSDMTFDTESVSSKMFDDWVRRAQSAEPVLDAAAYRELLRQSVNVAPMMFGRVTPGLFDAVATQALPPGEGPKLSARGDAKTSADDST